MIKMPSSDPVIEMLERAKPAIEQLSFGGMMGFCSGMAFRRVGRAFGVVIGVGFMGIQAASSAGYLEVDWEKIKVDVIKPLDVVSRLTHSLTRGYSTRNEARSSFVAMVCHNIEYGYYLNVLWFGTDQSFNLTHAPVYHC
jgi:uncharacterized membrane protein (Fun14 family)